jgi:L-ascorbate metabolism protein UlaG (beta-lactamase superfamily)
MNFSQVRITYIGTATALIEWGGLRMLTDPAFDPAGSEYKTNVYVLRKTAAPALEPSALGRIALVLLSHDHHFDNLDRSGREFLKSAGKVVTTLGGAERLGGNSAGLTDWQSIEIAAPDGKILHITATPARHGPAGSDRGPVNGFVLAFSDSPGRAIYISGDTVWYEGIAEVAKRFHVTVAILFLGAARIPQVGPHHLTMTAAEGIEAARAFRDAEIVPLHYEGWEHFSESRDVISRAFVEAGIAGRVHWMDPGATISLAV